VTRALTSKDPTTTKRTFLFGSPGQFVRLGIPVLFAVAAFCYVANDPKLSAYFFPEGVSYFRPDGGPGAAPEHADQAMPLILGKIIPTGLLGVIVAGMMAAFMSTHDSYFLCWSSVITRDVIGPIRRRELSDKSQIRVTRISIIVIGVFLLVWGVWYKIPDSVWTYMAVTGSVYMCGSIVALVGGMYWKRASNAGAMAALLGGLISLVAVFLPDEYRNNSMLMGILGVANYAFCLLAFIVFSLLLPNRPPGIGGGDTGAGRALSPSNARITSPDSTE
jgi:SSS family solute:Na+ symporter